MLSTNNKSFKHLTHVCIVAALFLILLSFIYWQLPDALVIKTGNYIQIVTVFILMVTSVIGIMTFKYQLDDRNRAISLQYSNVTQNTINDIDKTFMNTPALNRLYFEMYSNNPTIKKIRDMQYQQEEFQETPEMLKLEHHMAGIIFQKIADIYFCEQLDATPFEDGIEWINSFKNWMKSPILRSHWRYFKLEHHPSVRNFIETVLLVD